MKYLVTRLKALITFIFMVITLLITPIITFAGQGNVAGGGNEDQSEWDITWEDRIDGQNVSSKKLEKDDLIVIKVVAKAR